MTSDLPESGILGWLKLGIAWLGLPGLILNLIIAGNVHLGALWIINSVNVVVYSVCVYCLLSGGQNITMNISVSRQSEEMSGKRISMESAIENWLTDDGYYRFSTALQPSVLRTKVSACRQTVG